MDWYWCLVIPSRFTEYKVQSTRYERLVCKHLTSTDMPGRIESGADNLFQKLKMAVSVELSTISTIQPSPVHHPPLLTAVIVANLCSKQAVIIVHVPTYLTKSVPLVVFSQRSHALGSLPTSRTWPILYSRATLQHFSHTCCLLVLHVLLATPHVGLGVYPLL